MIQQGDREGEGELVLAATPDAASERARHASATRQAAGAGGSRLVAAAASHVVVINSLCLSLSLSHCFPDFAH